MTPQEQAALEAFGDAWMRMRQVERAVRNGDGPSFVHADAIADMQKKAVALRECFLREAQK